MKLVLTAAPLLLVLALPLRAQTPLHVVPGPAPDAFLGSALAGVGDVDGDGRADFATSRAGGFVQVRSGASGALLYELSGSLDFGAALAGVGDVDLDGRADFLVGEPSDATLGAGSGRVVLVSGATGAEVRSYFGHSGSAFGSALAVAGDVDADGVPDFVAGAPRYSSGGAFRGAAHLISTRTKLTKVVWFGAAALDFFGSAVAGAGDVNADGVLDVLVGAPLHDGGGDGAGRAQVFSGANGAPLHSFLGGDAGDQLGVSLAGLGDLDLDGHADFAVGAVFDALAWGLSPGVVRVHSGATGALLYALEGGGNTSRFGHALAALPDLDGDGRMELLVGAPQDQVVGPNDGGRAFVHSGASGTLLLTFQGDSTFACGDMLGQAVAAAGDLDGDGVPDLLVGAPCDGKGGDRSGTAYALSGACLAPSAGGYCTGKVNSQGCVAALEGLGTPDLAGPDDFRVRATSVLPGTLCWLVYGIAEGSQPFQGGVLCVAPPLGRLPPLPSGGAGPCSGSIDQPLGAAFFNGQGLLPGNFLYVQVVYRDPAHPDGTGLAMSDALRVTVCR